nr:MAG TPA: hypothetical protein [Caudoviricetes sp.]
MGVLEEVENLKKELGDKKPTTTTQVAQVPVSQEENSTFPLAESGDVVKSTVQQAMLAKVKDGAQNDMRGLVRDMTYVKGASDLQEDEHFRQTYQKELGQQLVQDLKDEGKRAAIVEQSKKQQARNIRNQAFYDGCKPIFTLLGIESAYGLVPMAITVVLLMIPFLIVCFVRFIINSVNSIFTAIAGFRKPAYWLCSIVIVLVITAGVVLGAMWCIDYFFGTDILKIAGEAANTVLPQ